MSTSASPPPHSPKCIWIGCCDARVVPEDALSRPNGDVFAHRNIANLFLDNDTSIQASFDFAMSNLNQGIDEVFVVGHTDCGGVNGSYAAVHVDKKPIQGPLGQWLEPVVAMSRTLGPQVMPDALAARNLEAQFNRLVASATFRNAERIVWAHGRLYDVQTRGFDTSVSHFQTNFGPGLYRIINAANGPIDIGTRQGDDVPIVRANQAAVWNIQLSNARENAYTVRYVQSSRLIDLSEKPTVAVGKKKAVWLDPPQAQPTVWQIVPQRDKTFSIQGNDASERGYWSLPSNQPRTQVALEGLTNNARWIFIRSDSDPSFM